MSATYPSSSNIIDYCVTYSYIFIYIRFYFGDSGPHLDNVVNGGAQPLGYILLHLVLRGYSTYNNAAGRTIKQTKKNPRRFFFTALSTQHNISEATKRILIQCVKTERK